MTRDELEELAMMALAAGSGAADSTTFGLSTKIAPEFQRRLKEENPISYGVGEVGSMFIPGTGVVGMGSKLYKAARGGKTVVRAAKAAQGPIGRIMAKIGEKALKGGAAGAIEAGGQTAIRNMLGTGDGDVLENAKTGGAIGFGLGAAAPVIGSVAKRLYAHPKIFDPKNPKSPELMEKLMNEGVWGGEGTFRREAQGAKDNYNKLLAPMRKKIANEETSMFDVAGLNAADDSFSKRWADKEATGMDSAAKQFEKTFEGTRERLSDKPKMSQLVDHLSVLNKELAGLKPQKRAEAITGVGGTASNADEALGAMKSSIERVERNKIKEKFGKRGEAKVKQAKESYGRGRNLERALDRPESLSQLLKNILPGPAVAGTVGGLTAGTVGLPAVLTGAAVGAGTAAAKSLPGRTGGGVLLNKISKNPVGAAAKSGRATEYLNRDEPAYRMNAEGAEETETGRAIRENPFLEGLDLEPAPAKKASPSEKPKKDQKNRLVRDREENIFLEGLDL